MYRQEVGNPFVGNFCVTLRPVGNPFVGNFCVTLRPCEHIQL